MPKKKRDPNQVMTKQDIYIEERNKLIPTAVKFANNLFGKKHPAGVDNERWANGWNLAYHGEMNKLWKHFNHNRGTA